MTIKAILFDLDDTLYDRAVIFRRWAERFVHSHLPTDAQARQAEIVALFEKADGGGYGDRLQFTEQIRHAFPTITDSPEAILEMFRVGFAAELFLDDETKNVLDFLAAHHLPFGIVTNGPTLSQHRKISQLGLDKRTGCIFISEEFGSKKPDPRIFQAAASSLGVTSREILFVGDNPENDIFGAKNAGMQTAWLSWGKSWPTTLDSVPDTYLNRVTDLILLLS